MRTYRDLMEIHSKFNVLENEKNVLQNKHNASCKSLSKLAKGQENLEKLLGS